MADLAELERLYQRAQRDAETHIAAVREYEYLLDETPQDGWDELPDNPAFGAWCGCDTCYVREVLHAAMPVLEEIFQLEQELGIFPAA